MPIQISIPTATSAETKVQQSAHARNRTRLAVPVLALGLLAAPPLHAQAESDAKPTAAPLLAKPLPPRKAQSDLPLFSALDPKDTGVEFVNALIEGHPLEHLYASEKAVGGVAIGDVDGDGKPDLYFTNGPRQNRLFRQVSDFKFEDITEQAGVGGGNSWGAGAAMVDIDNDGDLDIYVANYATSNHLFLNKGDGTFEEKARHFGLHSATASHMPAFCDYDRDGDLDLYLLTNRFHSKLGQPRFGDAVDLKVDAGGVQVKWKDPKWGRFFTVRHTGNLPDGRPQFNIFKVAQPDRLFRNDGPIGKTGRWKFTDASKTAGLAGPDFGLSATWWDFNQDGWPDLWVGNDFDDPDRVYRNNADGTFTDVVKEIGPHTSWFSMGADFGDLNGDGLPDFLIADMSGTNHFKQKTAMGAMGAKAEFLRTANPQQYMRNALFLNSGTERFLEGAFLAGLANSDWTWTVKLADLDNDGRTDVFLTNGMTRNFNDSDGEGAEAKLNENEWDRHKRAGTPELKEQNLAFRNRGDLKFDNVSKKWGLDLVGMSFAAAHADLDGDGDLDLVVSNAEAPATIYRNNESAGNRLMIRLVGKASNSHGMGAKLTLETAGGRQIRELTPVRGYLSSNEPVVHFGLGDHTEVKQLTVDWPSGNRQVFSKVAVNQHLTITEPSVAPRNKPSLLVKPKPIYEASTHLPEAFHADNDYDDYARQPLLPNKYSRLGPGQAWGDIDGDGDDDFWIGSGYGQPGQVWRNDGAGRFTKLASPALAADANMENMGGIWFDADGDKDLDLYVVNGGYEFQVTGVELDDRLYLNDGKGELTRASADSLPNTRFAGSVVTAADIDHDGDLDLFVGGRLIPGDYPTTPTSLLLRNEGGRFSDQTETLAPGLRATGLVTSALWSDANNDGWLDLLVTHEWGPVKYYRNVEGKLRDETTASGIAELTGWWNGIAGCDLDGDGDLDYLATNFGLNTKYHASAKKPALLYYGDFEGLGRKNIVEAEFEGDVVFPIRGRSCSTNAMGTLGQKYGSFKKFALDSLPQIYTPQCLEESLKLTATTLESGVFSTDVLQDGGVKFTFKPLPRIAQIAPAFGVVATEANGDGHPDFILAQNFYSPQPETGRMAGGLGVLLLGRGDGSFDAVSAHESGIQIPGDARSLTTADLDEDGKLDLLVGLNHSMVQTFNHREVREGSVFVVRLEDPEPGLRITCQLSDGTTQLAEWQVGGGYISQRAPLIEFGIPEGKKVTKISARWSDGTTTQHEIPVGKLVRVGR